MMDKIYKKLESKELEFAAYLAEVVSSEEPTTWISLIEDDEKFNQISLEEAKEFIKQLNNLLGQVYEILHSWDKKHSCYKHHELWRERSIDLYKKLCDNDIISDKFGLLED